MTTALPRNRLPAKPFTIEGGDKPEPGFWMMYVVRGGVLAPARIWICDHAPYEPENKRDRWPASHLAAEIAGRWVEVYDVWWRVCLRNSYPNHWKCAHPLIPQDGLTVEQEYEYQVALLDHAKKHEPDHPLARPYKPVTLARLPLPF
jgi:hypothetical protein